MRKLETAVIATLLATGLPGAALAQDHNHGDHGGHGGGGGHAEGRPGGGAPQPQAQAASQPQQAAPQARFEPRGNAGGGWRGRPEGQAQGQGRPDMRGGEGWRGRAEGQPAMQAQQLRADRAEGQHPGYDRGNRADYRPDQRQGFAGRVDEHRGDDRRFDGRPDDRRFDNRSNYRPGGVQVHRGDYRPAYDRGWRNDWRNDRRYDWRGWRDSHRSVFSTGRYYAPRGWGYGYRRFSIGYRLPGLLFASNYWIADPWEYRLPPAYPPYRWVRYYNDVLLVDVDTGEVVDVIPDFFY